MSVHREILNVEELQGLDVDEPVVMLNFEVSGEVAGWPRKWLGCLSEIQSCGHRPFESEQRDNPLGWPSGCQCFGEPA